MDLKSILSRFDVGAYQNILGSEIIGTLMELGPKYLYADGLNKILLNNYSFEELLLNSKTREEIISVLRKDEAILLGKRLGMEDNIDPWKYLLELKYRAAEKVKLFKCFDLEVPEFDQSEWVEVHDIVPNYPLYSYQRTVLKKIDKVIRSEQNRVLLHMPTGSGKTRTTISFICRFLLENEGTNVVWFANSIELLDQAYEEFQRAWKNLGNRDINTVKYWAKSSVDLSQLHGSFIVAGLDKAYNALMSDVGKMSTFASNCSLVVMDEAHQAIAPTYKLLIESMLITNKASLLGLSATPGRTWNDPDEDLRLADFFYKQKAKVKIDGFDNPVDFLVKEGYLASAKNTPLLYKSGIELSEMDMIYLKSNYQLPQKILEKISEDRLRNLSIISKVRKLVEKHQRIILFGITKKHAIVLNSLLTALGIDSNVLTSDTSPSERKRIIEKFKISRADSPDSKVLCNYGILTTGFDAPETSCAVIARPTDSLVLYSQMVGRAIRGSRSGGNEEAEIVTVVDESLPGFGNVGDAFTNWDDVWNDI